MILFRGVVADDFDNIVQGTVFTQIVACLIHAADTS